MSGHDWEEEEHTIISDGPIELPDEIVRDRAYLILLTGAEAGRIFKLEEGATTMGRSVRAHIRTDDDSVSRMHATVSLRGTTAFVEDTGSANGTFVNGERLHGSVPLRDGDKVRVGDNTTFKFTFQDQIDEFFQQQLYDAALRDALTGAYNKRYLMDQLLKELRYASRHTTEVSLLLMDIDHFKRVNDTHGHVAGDLVLKQLADLVHKLIRTEDIFARYGGEEFALVARGISLDQAGMLGERVRAAVETLPFDIGNRTIAVTLSIGVANLQASMTEPRQLIEAADGALYAAKNSGRNRVLFKHPEG
jgi:diguanylate cyclase (GGDEF)-like protein